MTLAGINFKNGFNGNGGALYIVNNAHVSLQNCKLSSNKAGNGGGINANNVNNVNLYITSFDGNSANNGNDIYVWNSANVTVQSTCPPGWFGEPVAGSMLDTSTTGGGTISGNLTSFDDG